MRDEWILEREERACPEKMGVEQIESLTGNGLRLIRFAVHA